MALLLGGCSLDSLLKNDELPPDVTDPALTTTPAGALAVYNGTIMQFQIAFGGHGDGSFGSGLNVINTNRSFVPLSGLFTDELQQPTGSAVTTVQPINARSLSALGPTSDDQTILAEFSSMQRTRAQAGQAIGLLTQYMPEQPALAGHMYAVEAYAEILLAELYCSGIPLSTVDYQGNYTLRLGSTTEQVFTHALALLDTGLTLAADSTRFVNLIRMGQGRAKLALGQYAAAAASVAAVPDQYNYALHYGTADNLTTTDGHDERNFAAGWAQTTGAISLNYWAGLSVANLEGGNGMPFISSGDPRTTSTQVNGSGFTGYRANKYATTGATSIVLASGVEARLIQAEAALQAGDASWLTTLNMLRTNGMSDPPDTLLDTLGVTGCNATSMCGSPPASNAITQGQLTGYPPVGYAVAFADTTSPAPAGIQAYCQSASWYQPCAQGDSMVVYTYVKPRFWHAGAGSVGGLAPLDDPGVSLSGAAADSARVDLVFRERAFWLFLTGHRQGDLRRLVRQYNRTENTVYPAGPYPILGNLYGTDVSLPIPTEEATSNPLFTGCASTEA